MGSEIHITRRANWADPATGPAITLREFKRVVDKDRRFQRTQDVHLPRARVFVGEHSASSFAAPVVEAHKDGDIAVRNPSPKLMGVLHELAQQLRARVVGDYGEEYDERGRVCPGTAIDSPAARAGEKYFVVEVGSCNQYRYAWAEVFGRAQYRFIDHRCRVCAAESAKSRWEPPHEVVLKQPKSVGDMVYCFGGPELIVSDRFRRLYEAKRLRGITDWIRIHVRKRGAHGSRGGPAPVLWGVYFATSAARLDPSRMAVQWMDGPDPKPCPRCGPAAEDRSVARLVTERNARVRHDLFSFANMGWRLMASRRAVAAMEDAGMTNVAFVPMSRFARRHF